MKGLIKKNPVLKLVLDRDPTTLPRVRKNKVPGKKSKKLAETLRRFECPEVTFVSDAFPVFFKKARRTSIYDADGNRYLDLTACFGVVNAGHGAPAVVRALQRQSGKMWHGMGDVHPHEIKVTLLQRLSEITPGNLNQTILSSTGSEAVETALKTAVIATRKTGLITFSDAYHGLSYGTLPLADREYFRKPFEKQLSRFAFQAPYPNPARWGNKALETTMKALHRIVKRQRRSPHPIGAVVVEPIQGRGGVLVPPSEFLPGLREFCNKHSVLLIADEIMTGFGRTGFLFALERNSVTPDILCLGKGMANGFPISACIGTSRVMHSWGVSQGEALHTSTFLGNPLGAAAALSTVREIQQKKLAENARKMGEVFRRELYKLKTKYPLLADVRGMGLMIGMELAEKNLLARKAKNKIQPATEKARRFVAEALKAGLIVLNSGPQQNVISLTPPLVITEKEILFAVKQFDKIFQQLG